eukprot:jgi/Mesvir1/6235/Mv00913-RA.1
MSLHKHFPVKKSAPLPCTKHSGLQQKDARQRNVTGQAEREHVQRGSKEDMAQASSLARNAHDAPPTTGPCSKRARAATPQEPTQRSTASEAEPDAIPAIPDPITSPVARTSEPAATPSASPARPAQRPASPTPIPGHDGEQEHVLDEEPSAAPSDAIDSIALARGDAILANDSTQEAIAANNSKQEAIATCISRWPCREKQISLLLRMLATGTDATAPLLLHGPPGTGKTGVLRDVLRCSGVRHVYVSATSSPSPRSLFEAVVGQLLAYPRAAEEGYTRCPRRVERVGEFVLEVRAALMVASARQNNHSNSSRADSSHAPQRNDSSRDDRLDKSSGGGGDVTAPSSLSSPAAEAVEAAEAAACAGLQVSSPAALTSASPCHARGNTPARAQQQATYIVVDDAHRLRQDRKGPWANEPNLLPALCRLAELTGCNVAVVLVGREDWASLVEGGAPCGQVLRMPAYTREEVKRVLQRWPPPGAMGEPQMYHNFVRLLVDTHTATTNLYELKERTASLFTKYCEPTHVAGVNPGDTVRLSREFISFLKGSGLLGHVLTSSSLALCDSNHHAATGGNSNINGTNNSNGYGNGMAAHAYGAAARTRDQLGLPASLARRQSASTVLPSSPFGTLGEEEPVSMAPGSRSSLGQSDDGVVDGAPHSGSQLDMDLPLMSRYIILAAYIASRNANSLDARVFSDHVGGNAGAGGSAAAGAGGVKRGRKRSSAGAVASDIREAEAAREAHLQLPGEFPLERLLAILQAILQSAADAGHGTLAGRLWAERSPTFGLCVSASHSCGDDGARAGASSGNAAFITSVTSPGQHSAASSREGDRRAGGSELGGQASSLATLVQVGQLVSLGLLSRVVGTDPLDGGARFRCNVGTEFMNKVARNLGVPMHTYLPLG